MKRQRRIYTGEAAVDAILEESPTLLNPVRIRLRMESSCVLLSKETTRHRTYVAVGGLTTDPEDSPIACEPTPAALRRSVLEWLRLEADRQQKEKAKATDVLPGQTSLPLQEPTE